LIILYFL